MRSLQATNSNGTKKLFKKYEAEMEDQQGNSHASHLNSSLSNIVTSNLEVDEPTQSPVQASATVYGLSASDEVFLDPGLSVFFTSDSEEDQSSRTPMDSSDQETPMVHILGASDDEFLNQDLSVFFNSDSEDNNLMEPVQTPNQRIISINNLITPAQDLRYNFHIFSTPEPEADEPTWVQPQAITPEYMRGA